MDNYNEFIYKRTYARFNNELGRRENWEETVDRWFTNMPIHAKLNKEQKIYLNHTKKQMLNMDVLPAMRTLWTAGDALYQNHIGAFNCAYTAIDKIESFSEILYILMHGTGVGLSVEERYTEALPIIKEKVKYHPRYRFIIEDSKEGWKDAVLEQTKALYEGRRIDFVYNQIREAGAPLKTFGGRASGYKPLKELLDFMESTFDKAINRKLYTWEVADIACMIAKAVIVGGVRRSSLMILSDIDDKDMSEYKNGNFYETHEYRTAANISAVIRKDDDYENSFNDLFNELSKSMSGERGIINTNVLSNRANMLGRDVSYWETGCNPCGEIILLNKEFCNLSEIVLRKNESLSKTLQKINTAIYFAIIQSQLTDYKNLSEEWHNNCEKEKLIGVSLTGIYDWLSSDTFINKDSKNDDPIYKKINIEKAKQTIIAMKEYGKKVYNTILDTFPNLAGDIRHECIFTIKPSGTASQLVGASSGIKPEQSEYYIRRVRVDAKDPLALLLIESGVEFDYEVGQDETNATTYVFSFYRKSYSDERLTLPNLSVKDQLDIYKLFNDNWIDHNPSATISVGNNEWDIVKDFLLENKDSIGGISFYPRYDGYHKLMPYEEITKEQYEELSKNNVNIDFNELAKYESTDNTEGAKSYACHAGNCEI